MIAAEGTIAAACGLRIARRGRPVGRAHFTVVEVAPVRIPSSPALAACSEDGLVLHRLWSLPDRLVIDFLDGVCVEVRDDDGSIVFSRALPPDVEDHLVLDQVLPYILTRRGALVLHGGLLIADGCGVVLTGHSGAGKSTLTAFLGERAWTVGGDDAAVLEVGPPVTVQPTYPTVRLTPEALQLLGLPGDAGAHVAGRRRLDLPADRIRQEPVALAAVARLRPVAASEAATFTRIHGAEALDVLLTNAFHADIGPGRALAHALDGLAQVAESVIVGELAVPRGREGLAAAERVLRDLVRS